MAVVRRGRTPRFSGPDGRSVTEEAFLSKCVPGLSIAMYYDEDPQVWHEGQLIYPSCESSPPASWWVLSPDGDCYVIPLQASEENDGPQYVALCSATGNCDSAPWRILPLPRLRR